jgi:Cys-rich protein (TIGR01571 family)
LTAGWWGCWCPWLLQARTVHSYDLATSFKANASYWGAIFLFLLLVLAGGPLGFLLGIGVICWLVHRGATWRRRIREAEGIEGDFSSDCMIHCCCSPCAVCQEARQAKHSHRPVLDFCSGEDLTSQQERYEAAAESNERGGSFLAHLASLSQTSRLILGLCGLLFLIAVLANAKRPMNILVLLLTFVEVSLCLGFIVALDACTDVC